MRNPLKPALHKPLARARMIAGQSLGNPHRRGKSGAPSFPAPGMTPGACLVQQPCSAVYYHAITCDVT